MRVLFVVSGLGLGNSTRCHAVVQKLHAGGAEVEVLTSGNGLWYFRGRPEVSALHEIESLYYSAKHGRISIVNTAASLGRLSGILRRNGRRLGALLDERRPDVVVVDSDYTVWPMRRRKIPSWGSTTRTSSTTPIASSPTVPRPSAPSSTSWRRWTTCSTARSPRAW